MQQSTDTTEAIEALLHPKSIAIVGATDRPSAIGERVIRYLLRHGYNGKILPVNPKYDHIKQIPCFASLTEVAGSVDLAIIALPADQVLSVIEECIQKRVKVATIFASGFAEAGPAGIELQKKVRETANRGGLRVCGPNCVGTFNIREGIAASFSSVAETEKFIPGNVGIVAQSGGQAGGILDRAQEKGLGVSYVVSCGNELDLEASDYIGFMLDDPGTQVIAAFIEGFKNGAKFREVAGKALELGKPLVILKIGRSKKGERAAASHTGALTGSDIVYDAVFRQLGVLRVEDIDELVDTACFLSWAQPPKGNRLGVVSPSGGAGILIADKCEQFHLQLPELSTETTVKLATLLPPFVSPGNPLDASFGEPNQLTDYVKVFAQDANLDAVLFQVPTVAGDFGAALANGVVEAASSTTRPLATLCTGGALSRPAVDVLRENRIPFFLSFDSCFRAISQAAQHSVLREQRRQEEARSSRSIPAVQPSTAQQVRNVLESGVGPLTEYDSKLVLSAYSIPCTREGLARTQEEAVAIANQIGYPVAMKVQSPEIPHKTEAQVIELGIDSDQRVLSSFQGLQEKARKWDPAARVTGILVQEMVSEGVETIAGISYDPVFGPVILFGLGGVFAEVLKDVSVRVGPFTKREAESMIREIRGFPVLHGARGRGVADLDALADVLMKLSQLAVQNQGLISQLDINPLVVFEAGKGAKAVDGLIILEEKRGLGKSHSGSS